MTMTTGVSYEHKADGELTADDLAAMRRSAALGGGLLNLQADVMSPDALASILEHVAARLRAGDSLAGSIEWTVDLDEDVENGERRYVLARGHYRDGDAHGVPRVTTLGDLA